MHQKKHGFSVTSKLRTNKLEQRWVVRVTDVLPISPHQKPMNKKSKKKELQTTINI